MEVEAVDEGTIARILVPEGTQDVPVNNVIAVLAADGEDIKAAASGGGASAKAEPKAEAKTESKAEEKAGSASATRTPDPSLRAPAPKPASSGTQTASAPSANGHARIFSSPLARRLAKEAGIERARSEGIGPHGRVVARDVEQA